MKIKRTVLTILVFTFLLFYLEPGITLADSFSAKNDSLNIESTNSSKQFHVSIPANTTVIVDSGFSFEAGETFTVKASYSPNTANVKYGLVASDGLFYGISAKGGILDYTFAIGVRGTYYFAVVNNSSVPVSVSGYINY